MTKRGVHSSNLQVVKPTKELQNSDVEELLGKERISKLEHFRTLQNCDLHRAKESSKTHQNLREISQPQLGNGNS